MKKEIKVFIPDLPGSTQVWPACEEAMKFAKIAKTTKLTRETCILIKSLGYEFTCISMITYAKKCA